MEYKVTEITNELSVGTIEQDLTLEIYVNNSYENNAFCYINKEQAIKLIAHLQEQFGI